VPIGAKTAGSAIPIQTLKKKTKKDGRALISGPSQFRQDSIARTGVRGDKRRMVPVTGQSKSVKIWCIDLWTHDFITAGTVSRIDFDPQQLAKQYRHREAIFDSGWRLAYHRKRTVGNWFDANRGLVERCTRAPYSGFNPTATLAIHAKEWHSQPHTSLNLTELEER